MYATGPYLTPDAPDAPTCISKCPPPFSPIFRAGPPAVHSSMPPEVSEAVTADVERVGVMAELSSWPSNVHSQCVSEVTPNGGVS